MVESGSRIDPAGRTLLSDFSEWRELLARSIARNNYHMRSEEIATAVNQIIFRILFIQIAEDRGLIETDILKKIHTDDNPWTAYLHISQKIDDAWMYSGVSDLNKKGVTDTTVIEDHVIRTILSELSSAERPYNFASVLTETIAQAISQYLEKTTKRSATHKAVIVDTQTTIQSRGLMDPAPSMIDYMVKSTVNAALAGRSDKELLPIRVLDPVCGAGYTLLSVYRCLIDASGSAEPTFEEKKEILLGSITGVDVDRQCILAAKLLLVIKLLEHECIGSLPGDFFTVCREIFHGLQHTLQCGNPLIGPEIANDEQYAFCPPHERHSLNPFEWKDRFPEIFASGGFDAIIGVPPCGTPEMHACIQHYFQQHFTVYHPMADRSALYIEKGLSLLRPGGIFSSIIPNMWMRANHGKPLRKFLLTKQIEEIVEFKNLPAFKTTITYPCIIRVSNNEPAKYFWISAIDNVSFPHLADYVQQHRYPMEQGILTDGGWTLGDKRAENLLKKLQSIGTPLEEFVMGRISCAIENGMNRAFIIDEKIRNGLIREDPHSEEVIKPLVYGQDIKRYQSPDNDGHYLILTFPGIKLHYYPAILKYLKQFKNEPMHQPRDRVGKNWAARKPGDHESYEIQKTIDYTSKFEKPKIVVPKLFRNASFAFDKNGMFFDNKTIIIHKNDPYLLGILNSKISKFFIFSTVPAQPGGYYESEPMIVSKLPIYTTDFDNPQDKARHDRMITLVTEMLELHKHLSQAKTDQEKRIITEEIESTDRQIDSLVYGLYGLTADEIAVVEESMEK